MELGEEESDYAEVKGREKKTMGSVETKRRGEGKKILKEMKEKEVEVNVLEEQLVKCKDAYETINNMLVL